MTSGIRIGVRGFPPGERPSEIDTFEIDGLDPNWITSADRRRLRKSLHAHQGLTLAFGHFYLRGVDSTDRRERARSAVETYSLFGAEASQVRVPPSLLRSECLRESLWRIHDEFKRAGLPVPRIDLPPSHLRDGMAEFDLVGDPVWNPALEERRKAEWRIHGYHPTRWIRLYPAETLATLAREALRHRPARIIFAHSQRFTQAAEFAAILARRSRKEPTDRRRSVHA